MRNGRLDGRHESSLPNKLVGCVIILMAVTTPDLNTEERRPLSTQLRFSVTIFLPIQIFSFPLFLFVYKILLILTS